MWGLIKKAFLLMLIIFVGVYVGTFIYENNIGKITNNVIDSSGPYFIGQKYYLNNIVDTKLNDYTYDVSDESIAEIDGNILTIKGIGTVEIVMTDLFSNKLSKTTIKTSFKNIDITNHLYDNYNKTNFSIDDLEKIKELDFYMINNFNLTELFYFKNLERLTINSTSFYEKLDLPKLDNLKYLSISNVKYFVSDDIIFQQSNLEYLKIEKSQITEISFNEILPKLTYLDLSNNPYLSKVYYLENLINLQTFIKDNTNLTDYKTLIEGEGI